MTAPAGPDLGSLMRSYNLILQSLWRTGTVRPLRSNRAIISFVRTVRSNRAIALFIPLIDPNFCIAVSLADALLDGVDTDSDTAAAALDPAIIDARFVGMPQHRGERCTGERAHAATRVDTRCAPRSAPEGRYPRNSWVTASRTEVKVSKNRQQ